ncbi:coproporphyrinogen-III oxidase family protein [Fusobacterium gonidiaformans]|uniref:coproporphyrinogen-III oxidase family protein n=1 Tax=Fusobacterium gonidiaformans TaxID=849 RepID=UPI00307F29F9
MFEKRYKSHHDVENILSKYIKKEAANKKDFLEILEKENSSKELGLYLHTPYCDKICSFCNMNRKKVDAELEEYHEYLCQQIEYYGKFPFCQSSELEVVFFGGGTPTIYSNRQLENILQCLQKNFKFSNSYEMTFETTLHNLSVEKAKLLQANGVNRLSVGIQTFSDRGRKILNRSFGKKEAFQRLKALREAFHGLLCIDIIYNYPEQSDEEVLEDIRFASQLGIDSISFYSLMIQEGSEILKNLSKESIETFYDVKRDEQLHNLFYQEALTRGYHLLELTKITNGKDKYRYIRSRNLLPIGVGAGGHLENIGCYHMNKKMTFYSKNPENTQKLTQLSVFFQFDSFSDKKLQELAEKEYPRLRRKIEEYIQQGWIQFDGENFSYTTNGVFWGNNINAELLEMALSYSIKIE